MTPEERQKLNEVYDFMKSMEVGARIPFAVGEAINSRISVRQLEISSKDADSEDIIIDEAGASTKNVLNDPDGFLEINIDGTIYYIPYYG